MGSLIEKMAQVGCEEVYVNACDDPVDCIGCGYCPQMIEDENA